jgi:hypothetical protein
MLNVLDINDLCLVADAGGQQVFSPGYVLLQKGQDPLIGAAALAQSRLSPAATASRYWRDLSLNPAGINHSQVRHQADLVWHQIKEINAEVALDQSLILCPSHYGEEQLGLLSGILKALEIFPSALIKRALAAARLNTEANCYLEFQLHQTLLTLIHRKDGEAIVEETRALAGEGYQGAVDAMLKAIQKRFIKETRFDPLHHANTEQQLVDSLPETLERLLVSDTTVVQVQTGNEEYRAEIRKDELGQALGNLWQEIRSAVPNDKVVLVDQTLFDLPGFGDLSLQATNVSQEALSNAARALSLPESYDPDAPIYLTRNGIDGGKQIVEGDKRIEAEPETEKSFAAASVAKVETAPADNKTAATHLLCQGVALRSTTLWLGLSAEGRLAVSADKSEPHIGVCKLTKNGLEIEAVGDIQINGEKLVGSRILALSDHLSSSEFPGGITAIRVFGDVD